MKGTFSLNHSFPGTAKSAGTYQNAKTLNRRLCAVQYLTTSLRKWERGGDEGNREVAANRLLLAGTLFFSARLGSPILDLISLGRDKFRFFQDRAGLGLAAGLPCQRFTAE